MHLKSKCIPWHTLHFGGGDGFWCCFVFCKGAVCCGAFSACREFGDPRVSAWIIHEDEHCIVLNKPAGIPTQGAPPTFVFRRCLLLGGAHWLVQHGSLTAPPPPYKPFPSSSRPPPGGSKVSRSVADLLPLLPVCRPPSPSPGTGPLSPERPPRSPSPDPSAG